MTHRNGIGKQGARIAIFQAYLEPSEAIAATQYVGPTNYFSLVWSSATDACLYVHDEFTPGGHLIACTGLAAPERVVGLRYEDCTLFLDLSDAIDGSDDVTRTVSLEVPELCLHVTDFTIDEETNQLCIVMSDETTHCIDLTPVLPVYSVMENPEQEGQYCFYHGDTQMVCWWQGGFTVENEDGSFTITNPDGTTVTIPAPFVADQLEIQHNADQTVCMLVNGESIGCWQQGDVVGEDTDTGIHYARKPDGTMVTWDGRNDNSVTTASLNAAEETVTIVNPDGQTITFPYGAGGSEVSVAQDGNTTTITVDGDDYDIIQTRVQRGTGGQAAMHTLTAQHGGTWPNEAWRETWMERQGDIVEIHSWNPNTNSWDSVAIEAPENIVILNNPVIYINSATGSANPPINSQADLANNPFDNFQSVRNFMNRTLVVGRVTLDIRGRFSSAGQIGAALFKNAPVTIRGNNGEFGQAIIEWGHAGTGSDRVGLAIYSGGVTVQDVTFEGHDEAEGDFAAAVNMQVNAALEFSGTIAFTGTYDNTRPGSSVGTLIRQIADNSQITVSGNTTLRYAMTGGANIREAFVVANGSRLTFGGNVIIQNAGQAITFPMGFLNINATSGMRLSTSGSAPNAIEVQGSVRHIAPASVVISPLASVNTTAAYGNRAATINYDFGVDVTAGGAQATMQIDAIGVLDDVAGP